MADLHRVLILGAGLVSRPIVRDFLAHDGVRLTVASLALEDARAVVDEHPRGRAHEVDVTDESQVEPLIADADLVVSLVPYAYHVQVARLAVRHRIPMVTTSYVSPQMRELDEPARRAGVLLLNETGLDPGIDHMSAMSLVDRAREAGGRIRRFASCTGGLPAPEAADNPWCYKFSWSPRGALLAGTQSARFLRDGRVHHVPGSDLFAHYWPYDVEGLGRFEMYPNRDSLRYIDLYDLHDVDSFIRGTIRYPGWCDAMKAIADLGLLDVEERCWPEGTTYAGFVAGFLPAGAGPLKLRLARRLGLDPESEPLRRIAWTGLLSDEPLPERAGSPLDVLAGLFQRRMAYGAGERDMVVMRHEIDVHWPDRPGERLISTLVCYGEPEGDSATARTVSLPAAAAGRLILDGRLRLSGVRIPTTAELYRPILGELESVGIGFSESSRPLEE